MLCLRHNSRHPSISYLNVVYSHFRTSDPSPCCSIPQTLQLPVPSYTCTLIHPLRLLILACTCRVALLFISMHSWVLYLSNFTFFYCALIWTRTITIKYCSISKSCANDSVLLDHVEYYTIVPKCSRLTVFPTPKRNGLIRGGFHLCMYVYSVRAVFNK